MSLKEIVAAMLTEGVTAQEFRDFFNGLGMGDHPYIVEVTQLVFEEVDRNPGSPVPEWTIEDADQLLEALSSPAFQLDSEFEPWSPRMAEEAIAQEDIASLAQACVQDGDDFRYIILHI